MAAHAQAGGVVPGTTHHFRARHLPHPDGRPRAGGQAAGAAREAGPRPGRAGRETADGAETGARSGPGETGPGGAHHSDPAQTQETPAKHEHDGPHAPDDGAQERRADGHGVGAGLPHHPPQPQRHPRAVPPVQGARAPGRPGGLLAALSAGHVPRGDQSAASETRACGHRTNISARRH